MDYNNIMVVERGCGLTIICNPHEKPKRINFYLGKDQTQTKPYDDAIEKWLKDSVDILVHSSQIVKFIDLSQDNYIGNLGHLHPNWYDDIRLGIKINADLVDVREEDGVKYGFIKPKVVIETNKIEGKIFELTPFQMEKFESWRKGKYDAHNMKTYTFCFTPTGIGTAEIIKCSDGTELDLTDYNNW